MEIFQTTESKAKQKKTKTKKKRKKHKDKVKMFPCGGGRFASLRGNQPPKKKKKNIKFVLVLHL